MTGANPHDPVERLFMEYTERLMPALVKSEGAATQGLCRDARRKGIRKGISLPRACIGGRVHA
jgi:hypothetical protein